MLLNSADDTRYYILSTRKILGNSCTDRKMWIKMGQMQRFVALLQLTFDLSDFNKISEICCSQQIFSIYSK